MKTITFCVLVIAHCGNINIIVLYPVRKTIVFGFLCSSLLIWWKTSCPVRYYDYYDDDKKKVLQQDFLFLKCTFSEQWSYRSLPAKVS